MHQSFNVDGVDLVKVASKEVKTTVLNTKVCIKIKTKHGD